MDFIKFPEVDFQDSLGDAVEDEILPFLNSYLKASSKISSHKKKEKQFMEMLSKLIDKINQIAKNGDLFEVAGNLTSAAYFLEEFNWKEAQQIYIKAIENYDKYMNKIEKEGKFNEACEISNRIADLYHNKLNDRESEKIYLKKCIEFNSAQIKIMEGFVKPRKLAILYYNLGDFHSKVEDWDNAIETYRTALEIVLKNNFYDIIVNVYFNLSDIYLFSGNEVRAEEIIEEARNYFSNEEEKYDEEQNHFMLSQIFQIQKNLNSTITNTLGNFRKYSRKEAYSYIELGKRSLQGASDYHKAASYYRGAALCYKENEFDYLESASCFLLAGNMFRKISKDYVNNSEAGLCYNDAAESFEEAGFSEKSVKLFDLAAYCALKSDNYEFAIEKLMKAYDLIRVKNLLADWEYFAKKICLYLKKLSDNELKNKLYFVSGTLLLESLPYYKKLGYSDESVEIKEILNQIAENYIKEYDSNFENGKNSTLSYIITLSAITYIALNDFEKVKEQIQKLDSKKRLGNSFSQINQAYKTITTEMLKAKKDGKKFNLSNLNKKIKKIFSNSIEIKLLNNFIFF